MISVENGWEFILIQCLLVVSELVPCRVFAFTLKKSTLTFIDGLSGPDGTAYDQRKNLTTRNL